MYNKNQTGKWLRDLDDEKRQKYMEMAQSQKMQYASRARKLWEEKEIRLQEKKED